jgi:hypothetical protein
MWSCEHVTNVKNDQVRRLCQLAHFRVGRMGRFAAHRPLRPFNSPIAIRTDDTTNVVKGLKVPRKPSISGLRRYRTPCHHVRMNSCAPLPSRRCARTMQCWVNHTANSYWYGNTGPGPDLRMTHFAKFANDLLWVLRVFSFPRVLFSHWGVPTLQ